MNPLVLAICIISIIAISSLVFVLYRRKNADNDDSNSSMPSLLSKTSGIKSKSQYEMKVSFDALPSLTEQEESHLVEIKDSKLLARIDNAVPGTLQAVANTGAVKAYQDVAKSAGQLYRAVIPKDAVLYNSKDMAGAVRGGFHSLSSNKVAGQANWLPVDNKAANNLATLGSVNAVMGVASMVVGQYYMTQINDQLDDISSGIEKIADFQQNEFKSKVYALVAEAQKASTFQLETIENNDLRNRELSHMKALEHECAQLLGQANLSLQDISDNTDVDYNEYEKLIGEAEIWFQYQQILLDVMYKIADLSYALNLGAVTRENSYALYQPYATQSEGTLDKLNKWHTDNVERLKIDVSENRRKRQGISGFFMGALGMINDDFNYKKISEGTVKRLEHQTEGGVVLRPSDDSDLYQEDVQLIAKDGKLYYLPGSNDSEKEDKKEE